MRERSWDLQMDYFGKPIFHQTCFPDETGSKNQIVLVFKISHHKFHRIFATIGNLCCQRRLFKILLATVIVLRDIFENKQNDVRRTTTTPDNIQTWIFVYSLYCTACRGHRCFLHLFFILAPQQYLQTGKCLIITQYFEEQLINTPDHILL